MEYVTNYCDRKYCLGTAANMAITKECFNQADKYNPIKNHLIKCLQTFQDIPRIHIIGSINEPIFLWVLIIIILNSLHRDTVIYQYPVAKLLI